MQIARLLRFLVDQGGSDLHLSAGEPPVVRIHGDLLRLDLPPLAAADAHRLVFDVMGDAVRRVFRERLEVDFAFELDTDLRFRVNAFMHSRGEGAVFRAIPTRVPTLAELDLPPVLRSFCDQEKGLVLVTGPTGSGKSTTLAAMIDYLNEAMPGHILTLEDPVEFVHRPRRAVVNQREVGAHTHSFAAALRSALREDPDVILVGELRDLETTALALTAAETGHLVFGTLHTSGAPKTVDRIIDIFPAAQQGQVRAMLAESLVAVVTQMLLKRAGGGRVAALEVLVGTPAVRNLIREGKTHQIASAMQAGGKVGMETMESAVADLLRRRLITIAEAAARLPGIDPATLLDRASRLEAAP